MTRFLRILTQGLLNYHGGKMAFDHDVIIEEVGEYELLGRCGR